MQGSWKGGEGCVREAGGSCERSGGKGAGGLGCMFSGVLYLFDS